MNLTPDVLVLGSGLPAACCAFEFARRGHRVEVYGEDLFGPQPMARWATVCDESKELLGLSMFGLAALHDARQTIGEGFLVASGSLIVAVDSLEWAKLQLRAERFKDAGIACEAVGGGILPAIEACLSNSLPGGVYVPDGLTFEPLELTAKLLQSVERASFGTRFRVSGVDGRRVTFVSGETAEGDIVVDTGGIGHAQGRLREVSGTTFVGRDPLTLPVSTGSATFGPTAGGWEAVSVRPVQTYQELRRAFPAFGRDDTVPARWWTTPDGLPIMGRASDDDGTLVAGGLEGYDLSVTMTAACVLAAMAESRPVPVDTEPFSPTRMPQLNGANG